VRRGEPDRTPLPEGRTICRGTSTARGLREADANGPGNAIDAGAPKSFGYLTRDATVVRGVLLPAGLTLLGDRIWTPRAGRRYGVAAPVAAGEPPQPAAVEPASRR
jgi:hypothetical protein